MSEPLRTERDTARALKRIALLVAIKFLVLIALTLAVLRFKGLI
jgi:hypothetical protein